MSKKTYSFIDQGNMDFVKDENEETIRIKCNNKEEAEDWLLTNHSKTDWTNSGTSFHCWEDD